MHAYIHTYIEAEEAHEGALVAAARVVRGGKDRGEGGGGGAWVVVGGSGLLLLCGECVWGVMMMMKEGRVAW